MRAVGYADILTGSVQVVDIFRYLKISVNLLRQSTGLSHSTTELRRNVCNYLLGLPKYATFYMFLWRFQLQKSVAVV